MAVRQALLAWELRSESESSTVGVTRVWRDHERCVCLKLLYRGNYRLVWMSIKVCLCKNTCGLMQA